MRADDDVFAVAAAFHGGKLDGFQFLEARGVFCQRMPGNVKTQGGKFVGQQFVFGPLFDVAEAPAPAARARSRRARETGRAARWCVSRWIFCAALHGAVDHIVKLGAARAKRIHARPI